MLRIETVVPIKDIGTGLPIQHNISSPSCMSLARSWLRKCEEHHIDCKPPLNASLPSRVIDVESLGTDNVKLVETRSLPIKIGKWATLSHCWGKVQPLTTTVDTLCERKRCITLETLPKTFHDAVEVTRALGLRYLWIDSLCILQDSQEDWEIEAAKMAEVYANSVITIAAVAAKDSRDGCFVPKHRPRPSIIVELESLAGEEYKVMIREVANKSHKIDIVGSGRFPNLPLSRRAWVLQERLLTNRLLMYTDCELVFECRMDLWCECGLYPLRFQTKPAFRFRARHQQSVFQRRVESLSIYLNWVLESLGRLAPLSLGPFTAMLQRAWIDGCLLDRKSLYRFWVLTVENYSRRCLTFDRDVLPALSGIATYFNEKLGDEYLAGIWRGNLLHWLLWSRSAALLTLTDEEHALIDADVDKIISDELKVYLPKRTSANRPPTWSWASIRAAVDWSNKWLQDELGFRVLAEHAIVMGYKCILASSNPTGSVLGGSLLLYGPIKEVRLTGYERERSTLLHRARVADVVCTSKEHDHRDSCLNINADDWAILDIPFDEPASIQKRKIWQFRVGVLEPPHMAQFYDFANQFLTNTEDISNTHTLQYYLLLIAHQEDRSNPLSFERCGLYIKHIRPGFSYNSGDWNQILIR